VTEPSNAQVVNFFVDEALKRMPYHEDLPQGTQKRRNWAKVREQLRRAKALLVQMEAEHAQ